MKTAIFPGSFDPFTIGHKDVVRSAVDLFDKVIIAVGYNSSKKGFFPIGTRLQIIKDSIKDLLEDGKKIEVISYTGLTVDVCRREGAHVIVRSIRTSADFEMESVIAQANKKLDGNITTIFVPATGEHSFISSTIVRDILINGGDVSQFMSDGIDINSYKSTLK